jgi:sugar lactone lactonase YvrE
VSVQSVVVDPADRLWILDTGSPLFQSTQYGGPKLLCVDLTTDQVVKKILFPQDVALPTTYLNDVRFDLRRGSEGMAFITDSAQKGPNGIIVVDLASGESWRQLNDHLSTKAEGLQTFLPIVEGRPFLEHQPDGSVKQGAGMGSDGIAISADGARLYYCPLGSRKLYSVDTEALIDRSLDDRDVAATVTDEGDKGGASDGLESDAAGHIYTTNYEQNAILRRLPGVSGRRWRMTSAYCGRTLSRLQQMGISMSQQTSYTAKLATTKDGTCAASLTYSSVSASKPNLSCCGNPTLGGTNWKWRIIYSICLRYN